MAIALVQQASAAFASQVGGAVTLPAGTQAGNTLIVVVSQAAASTGALISSITDDGATHATYVTPAALAQAGPPPSDNQSGVNSLVALAYALNVPAGIRNVTVTLAAAKVHAVSVSEWSGIVSASPSDASANGGGSVAATTFKAPALSPPSAGDLVIGAINQAAAAITFSGANSTPTTGWTELVQLAPTGSKAGIAYQIFAGVPTASSRAAWTGTSGKWGAIAMAFKAAAAGSALTQSVADTLAIADAPSSAATTTPADAVTVADATSSDYSTVQADAAAVADAVAGAMSASVADTLPVADAASSSAVLGALLADALAVADATSSAYSTAPADAVAVADLLTPARGLAATLADVAGIADAVSPLIAGALTQAIADALVVADATSSSAVLGALLADIAGVADATSSAAAITLVDLLSTADHTLADLVGRGAGSATSSSPGTVAAKLSGERGDSSSGTAVRANAGERGRTEAGRVVVIPAGHT